MVTAAIVTWVSAAAAATWPHHGRSNRPEKSTIELLAGSSIPAPGRAVFDPGHGPAAGRARAGASIVLDVGEGEAEGGDAGHELRHEDRLLRAGHLGELE